MIDHLFGRALPHDNLDADAAATAGPALYTHAMLPLRQWLGDVLDFCYPHHCAACAAGGEGGGFLCATCDGLLCDLRDAAACERCAMPLASDGAPCPYCLGKGVAPFERIVRLGVFADPIKQVVHHFKYHGRWPLGEHLADRLCATERAKGLLTETQVLVPVPLHFRRHVRRGYNQADVIACRAGHKRNSGIPVVHAVRRVRDTETQTHLSHEKRLANMRGAFALRRSARRVRGKHVVIVDDVMTTGATLKAVANVLRAAEPAGISAMVIAIADPRHRDFQAI
ncbi:MAG TPA: ComF family protein [Tepidisphaeraceae bacterium]|nr:ComF family protein [Tepidisphaeraceae bacterium]